MKANELMIGDWLYLGQTDIAVLVKAISADGDDTVLVKYKNPDKWGKYGEMVGNEDISPIPLSPEILKANGFKDAGFYSELLWNDAYQVISDCYSLSIRCKNSDLSLLIPCDMVHELQHALRVCGINKEIEL